MNSYKVSVIMPGLNEEENLASAVRNVAECFRSLNIPGQIIVVNDGSTDRTGEVASMLGTEYSFLKVIHHDRPRGIGASFWDGVKVSEAEIVAMLPGDGENDSFEILRYLPLMEHVDIIVPFIYNKNIRPLKRRMLSSLYRWVINVSFGTMLNYMNGTVMYRKAVFEGIGLECSGFFFQTELLVKCLRTGYLYAEVPSALSERDAGVSKATTFKSVRRVAGDYIGTMLKLHVRNPSRPVISPRSVTARRWRDLTKE